MEGRAATSYLDNILCVLFSLQSIIYYCMQSKKLQQWLSEESTQEQLSTVGNMDYVDRDPTFYHNIDEDYDLRYGGITRASFNMCYLDWIQYCNQLREQVGSVLEKHWFLIKRAAILECYVN